MVAPDDLREDRSTPVTVHPGAEVKVVSIGVVDLLVAAMLVTVVATPVAALAVLRSYRRAVERSMRLTGGGSAPAPNALTGPVSVSGPVAGHGGTRGPAPVRVVEAAQVDVAALREEPHRRRARARMTRNALVHAAAGALFALVAASCWQASGDDPGGPVTMLTVALLLGWPVVPTLLTVMAPGTRVTVAAWAVYLGTTVLLLGLRLPVPEAVELLTLFVAPPAAALAAVSGRRLRAVGPFLAVPVFVASAAVLLAVWGSNRLMLSGLPLPVALLVASAGAVAAAGCGFGYLAWCAGRYVRRQVSDEMVLIAQRWFLVAAWCSLLLLPRGGGPALGIWAGYLLLRVGAAFGLRAGGPGGVPVRLLLLRTFGSPRRGESLLYRLGTHWRYVGPVQMIAGPDLVSAALEPHEFLDRVRGRLARRFVADDADLAERLADVDTAPDPDGRYRVHELFCHQDTWKAALAALVRRTDVVLLDLREFDARRSGVTHEIRQLMHLVPLERVVAVVDGTTDHALLRAVLDDAWAGLAATSPNAVDPREWTMLRLTDGSGPDPAVLVWLLTRGLGEAAPVGAA
jgi:hypothetical protein